MPTTTASRGNKKRKKVTEEQQQSENQTKKLRRQDQQKPKVSLAELHQPIVKKLQEAGYEVLVASVISSTQIRKRVTQATAHLVALHEAKRLVLLHARTAEVCKLITIVELCKRTLSDEGKAWYQYNQLYELPERTSTEKTRKNSDSASRADESDSDGFEAMSGCSDKAAPMPAPKRRDMSMRVFLSAQPIPELRERQDTTEQRSSENDRSNDQSNDGSRTLSRKK